MSLTSGKGPLSAAPAGWFVPAISPGTVYVEPCRRRVRGVFGGRALIDSERALLVHRAGGPPTYAFPEADAAGVPSAMPEPAAPGHVRVPWDAVEAWYEEQEQVMLHARNPYHRVDVLRSNRRLRVMLGATVLVDTTDTMAVHETALDPRLYVPRHRVRTDLLVPSPTVTHCPYKGGASYWSAVVGGTEVTDVAWSYDDPLPESEVLRGHLCFDDTRLTVQAALPQPAHR